MVNQSIEPQRPWTVPDTKVRISQICYRDDFFAAPVLAVER